MVVIVVVSTRFLGSRHFLLGGQGRCAGSRSFDESAASDRTPVGVWHFGFIHPTVHHAPGFLCSGSVLTAPGSRCPVVACERGSFPGTARGLSRRTTCHRAVTKLARASDRMTDVRSARLVALGFDR